MQQAMAQFVPLQQQCDNSLIDQEHAYTTTDDFRMYVRNAGWAEDRGLFVSLTAEVSYYNAFGSFMRFSEPVAMVCDRRYDSDKLSSFYCRWPKRSYQRTLRIDLFFKYLLDTTLCSKRINHTGSVLGGS